MKKIIIEDDTVISLESICVFDIYSTIENKFLSSDYEKKTKIIPSSNTKNKFNLEIENINLNIDFDSLPNDNIESIEEQLSKFESISDNSNDNEDINNEEDLLSEYNIL